MPLIKRTAQTSVAVSTANTQMQGTQGQAALQATSQVALKVTPGTTTLTAARLGGTREAGDKTKAADNTMSKADWAAKDVRISRQGLFQAALQSVGVLQLNTGNTLEEYLALVEKTAERGLQFVNKA